jgi:DNA polymerase-3 subunit epsilon
LQEKVDTCSHYRIKECDGICRGNETVDAYNKKVEEALSFMRDKSESLLIREKGRTFSESAIVMLKNGIYMGYGFVDKDIQISTVEDLEAYLIPQKNTLETERIIQSYLTRNPHKVQQFTEAYDAN